MDFLRALPEEFPFYHLGNVKAVDQPATLTAAELADLEGVAFSLHGDARGLLLVMFDRGLDVSMYSELGNIIASQLATRLGGHTMISPPKAVEPGQLMLMLAPGADTIRRDYAHLHRGVVVTIRTLLLSAPSEGAAYV